MGFFREFQKFAMRGNVIDLAVGVVVGGAFGKITSSLVNDIIMPPLGLLISGVNFQHLAVVLKPGNPALNQAPVAIMYGSFIQTIVDFTIIAFAIFLCIRAINSLQQPPKPAAPKGPTQEQLLAEIRDLLAKDVKRKATPTRKK